MRKALKSILVVAMLVVTTSVMVASMAFAGPGKPSTDGAFRGNTTNEGTKSGGTGDYGWAKHDSTGSYCSHDPYFGYNC